MRVEKRTSTCEQCWGDKIYSGDICESCRGTGYVSYSVLVLEDNEDPMRAQVIFLKDEE